MGRRSTLGAAAAAAVALALAAPASAEDDRRWTASDTILEATYAAAVVVDWSQTNSASDDPRFEEKNPMLGRRPPRVATATYFCSMALAHAVVSYALPPTWRRIWQSVTIGYEGAAVVHSIQLGVGMRF